MILSLDEVNITDWTNLGTNAQIERRSFTIELKWTNTDNTTGTHTSTRTFPAALATMPLNVLRKHVEQMIIEVARVELGLNTWEDFL